MVESLNDFNKIDMASTLLYLTILHLKFCWLIISFDVPRKLRQALSKFNRLYASKFSMQIVYKF
jgi:hypothetical protein